MLNWLFKAMKLPIEVRFVFYRTRNKDKPPVWVRSYLLEASTTYEEIVNMLIKKGLLNTLNDPQLRYFLYLLVPAANKQFRELLRPNAGVYLYDKSAILEEGQTLESTNLIIPQMEYLICEITIVERATALKQEPISHPPSLGEILNAILASPEIGIINLVSSAVTITTALIIIAKSWKKTHQARQAELAQQFPQPSKTDIYAIRLRMTDGRERTLQKWLTEPDELKHFIDVFNQPSSQMKPTEVVFVLWNREIVVVDVTSGAQGNLQLDEMLKYLKIDPEEKKT
jgi:hypothetical protein